MFKNKKLDVFEDEQGLSITLPWFTPKAIFLAFFCVIWNSFLIFWYSSVGSIGASLFFYLFPLIHVAIGIGLSYYTLCLFMNKTYIDADEQHLWIHHSPIPWWKGNVDLPTSSIDQIFVKEIKRKNKNGASYTYQLQARLRDGSNKSLLDIEMMDSDKALELEEIIEGYLGIQDAPIKGEFGRIKTHFENTSKRRKRRRNSSTDTNLAGKYTGDEVYFDSDYYQILYDNQYDWKNGNTDKLLQLSNTADENILIYILQNRGVYKTFSQEKLSLYQANEIAFNLTQPANQFQFQGIQYQLQDFSEGEAYLSDQSSPITTRQWFYQTIDGKQHVRIVSYDGLLTYYKGAIYNFEQPLDLKNIENPQEQMLDSWDEEDLV